MGWLFIYFFNASAHIRIYGDALLSTYVITHMQRIGGYKKGGGWEEGTFEEMALVVIEEKLLQDNIQKWLCR